MWSEINLALSLVALIFISGAGLVERRYTNISGYSLTAGTLILFIVLVSIAVKIFSNVP